MTKLNFNDSMETLDQRDIFAFTGSLINGVFIQNKKVDSVSVAGYWIGDDKDVDSMETVEVYFQTWEKGESGKGSFFVWTNYRAKNHSCKNISISAKKWSRSAQSWTLKK